MRKSRLILCSTLLAAATGVSAVSLPAHAAIRKEIVSTENIGGWNLDGPDVLYAYELYLNSDEETRGHILECWPKLPEKAYEYVRLLDYESTPEMIREVIARVRNLDTDFPEPLPPAPVTPEPEIPQPEQPEPENPEQPNPENPSGEKPGADQKDPSGGSTDPDNPKEPGNTEKPEDPAKPDQGGESGKTDEEKKPEEGETKPKDTPDEDVKAEVSDKTDEEQKEEIEDKKTEGEISELAPASDPDAISIPLSFSGFSYRSKNRKIKAADIAGWYDSEPDYKNNQAWKQSSSAYNTPGLWGQCTWFAWGRFYEIYGFNPGFTGNGNVCVDQLLAAHPGQFERSDKPKAGAVFSSDMNHNHVGIILDVNPVSGMLLVQEGNLDGVSNPNWDVATADYRTVEISLDDLRALYGNVVFANPVEGKVSAASVAEQPKLPESSIEEVRAVIDQKAD